MLVFKNFDKALTESERRIMIQLTTPFKIQTFLDKLPYSVEASYRCPLRVLREHVAHCFDGALFAAAVLRFLGDPPLILNMIANNEDDDHLLALYKRDGYWGSIAKSNFAGLRFREPIYRNLRDLVMSYFEQFYNVERKKTLRSYTVPLHLKAFDNFFRWFSRWLRLRFILLFSLVCHFVSSLNSAKYSFVPSFSIKANRASSKVSLSKVSRCAPIS